jgi:hypothetical protein
MSSTQRTVLSYVLAAVVLAGAFLAQGCSIGLQGHPPRGKIVFINAEFYDKAGKFKVDAAKEAYLDLLVYHGYPKSDTLEKNLFVTDFGLGRFTEVGMGGCYWANDDKAGYCGMELFILPNQMVPEHFHVKTDKAPARVQTAHVRWGKVYAYTEGTPTEKIWAKIPTIELNWVTVRTEHELKVGQTIEFPAMQKHWLIGAPEGALMTEYSTYADPVGSTKFTDPKAKR